MPPSSALSLPVSAAPARQLSRANRPRKRKSIAEQLSFFAPAASVNMLHKTDGSHTNRPFFRSLCRTCGKTAFSQKDIRPRCVFCFFSSRKEIVPLSFSLEEKKINCGTAFLLCSCCFRQHAAQNGRFTYEPSVFSFLVQDVRENRLFSERHPPPLCLLFLFFKKRNRSPILFFLERKGRKENQLRNSFPSLLLLLPSTCCTKRTVHIRTVRFFVPCAGRAGKPPFLRKTSAPAVSFVSFLQEKKTSPPLKEKKSSPLLFAWRAA